MSFSPFSYICYTACDLLAAGLVNQTAKPKVQPSPKENLNCDYFLFVSLDFFLGKKVQYIVDVKSSHHTNMPSINPGKYIVQPSLNHHHHRHQQDILCVCAMLFTFLPLYI